MNSTSELTATSTMHPWAGEDPEYKSGVYWTREDQEDADRLDTELAYQDLEHRARYWGYYCIEPKPADPPLIKRLIMGALLVLAIAVDIARWVGAADLAINGWPISGIAVWAAAIPALLLIQGVAKAISPSRRSCPESADRMSNGPV